MGKLNGKVAVITGSSRGIGRAIAELFSREGAKVVVNSRHLEDAEKTAKRMGRDAFAVEADVSKPGDVKKMVEATVKRFGRIDILVNNAGIARFDPLTKISSEEWDSVLDVNLKGQFLCAREAVRNMMKRKSGGVIVNIASIAGQVGFNNLAHYCASKGAIIELTRELALELAPNKIRVNCIGPGIIETDMTSDLLKDPKSKAGLISGIPMGRVGKPEEIAKAALFLASEDSSYMTGQTVFVDGGWLTR